MNTNIFMQYKIMSIWNKFFYMNISIIKRATDLANSQYSKKKYDLQVSWTKVNLFFKFYKENSYKV